MERERNSMHGLKWGLIISAVYLVFLFLRYRLGAENVLYMSLFTFVGFVAVLILLFMTGITRRRQMGGFIELKDAFQTMFVAIVIYEFVYAVFNFIYLKYIDPEFFQKVRASTEELMLRMGQSQSEVDRRLEVLDEANGKKLTGSSVFINYLQGIAVSGVFALIFALIIKKKRDPFLEEQESYLKS